MVPTPSPVLKFLRPLLRACMPREGERPACEAGGGGWGSHSPAGGGHSEAQAAEGREHDRDRGDLKVAPGPDLAQEGL